MKEKLKKKPFCFGIYYVDLKNEATLQYIYVRSEKISAYLYKLY